jgi:hypothetical protein
MELVPDVLEAETVPEVLITNSMLMLPFAQEDLIAVNTHVLLEGI